MGSRVLREPDYELIVSILFKSYNRSLTLGMSKLFSLEQNPSVCSEKLWWIFTAPRKICCYASIHNEKMRT